MTRETTLLDSATAAILERVVDERFRRMSETTASADVETECVTEMFDTALPTDSATGTPPLRSRTTERRRERQASESRERAEAASSERKEQARTTDAKLSRESGTYSEAENMVESKSREVKQGGGYPVWAMLSLALCALLAARTFFKRRSNKH